MDILKFDADLGVQWAKQWSFRHSWQSWRDQYVRNADQYDVLIEKKIQELQKSQLPNNSQHAVRPPTPPSFSDGQPGRPLSLTVATNANLFSSATGDPAKATLVSSTQATVSTLPPLSHSEVDPEDLEYLASYFASNSIAKDDREKANTYQDMRDDVSGIRPYSARGWKLTTVILIGILWRLGKKTYWVRLAKLVS